MLKSIVLFFGTVALAFPQLFTTGETMGKDKISILISPSLGWTSNSSKSTFSFAQLAYGINNKIDIAGGIAILTTLGHEQANAIVATNIHLLKVKKISFSTWHVLGTGLHGHKDSCSVWWYPSLVASRSLGTITVYSGYAVTVPLGNVENKLFTSSVPVHNIPIGAVWTKGKSSIFAEYDYGPSVSMIGIGYAFQIK